MCREERARQREDTHMERKDRNDDYLEHTAWLAGTEGHFTRCALYSDFSLLHPCFCTLSSESLSLFWSLSSLTISLNSHE